MAFTEKEITLPDNAGKEAVMEDSATGRLHEIVCLKNSVGTLLNPATSSNQDPLGGYIFMANTSQSETIVYAGYMKPSGEWYIRKSTKGAGNAMDHQFCKGSSGFAAAWANPASAGAYGNATTFA